MCRNDDLRFDVEDDDLLISYEDEGYYEDDEYYDEDYDDSMDGDWDTGMASAGWGTDEDYGYYGEDEEW